MLRSAARFACTVVLAASSFAQMQMGGAAQDPSKMPSPPAKAEVALNGKSITIDYSSPRMRGRTGELARPLIHCRDCQPASAG